MYVTSARIIIHDIKNSSSTAILASCCSKTLTEHFRFLLRSMIIPKVCTLNAWNKLWSGNEGKLKDAAKQFSEEYVKQFLQTPTD